MKAHTLTLKLFLALLLVTTSFITLNAQNTSENKNKWWISGNLNVFVPWNCNVDYEAVSFDLPDHRRLHYRTRSGFTTPVNLGFGIKKVNEKNWFQEYSLTALNVSWDNDHSNIEIVGQNVVEPIGGKQKISIDLAMRWEYGKLFNIKGFKNLKPGISVSLDPFFHYDNFDFTTYNYFPFSVYRLGAEMALIPRLEYKVSDKLAFVIKIPVGFNHFYFEQLKVNHPMLTASESKTNDFSYNFDIRHFQSSIGLNYRI